MKNSTTKRRFDSGYGGWSVASRCLLCLAFLLAGMSVWAQTHRLTGRVTEDKGQAVVGASVIVKGTTQGITTDSNGSFALDLANGDITLVVSFIGYRTQEVAIPRSQSRIDIELAPESIAVDEVVVVGYGEQSRRSVTSSIAKLDGEALQNIPISTVGEGLKGKIAGLKVTQTNFSPGGGFSYQIRGGSSINGSNSPLVLVDGVERDFSAINPNDIASIDVLKDAASSAIYGAKASNGIILVTTKRGGYNKAPRITFEANWAWQDTETEIEFLNAREYIEVVRTAVAEYLNIPSRASDALSYLNGAHSAGVGNKPNGIFSTRYYDPATDVLPAGYRTMPDPINPSKTIMYRDTDWQDLLYNGAWWQNYYLGIDGGGERVRYSASLGYTDDEGVALSTGYNRVNFKSNLDAKITKRLTASFGVDFARTDTEAYANQRNTISRALANPPTMNAYYEDGTPVEGYNSSSQTPLFYDKYYDRSNQKNYLSLIGGLRWEIIDGLTANVQGSFFRTDSKTKQFIKANVFDATRKSSWGQTMTERQKLEAYVSYKESQRYHNHVVSFYSDDEGATWSGPFKWFTENRNSDPDRYLWTGFFKAGPGHAIQLKTGEHKGRILVGCDHKYQVFGGTAVPADSEDENYYGSHVAYSDDNGESWHMLELDEELHYGNECVPVELSDGRIYLDMRSTGVYKKQRGWSVSEDGGITWSRYTPNPLRTDPGCQGSIVNYNTNGVPSSVILASSNNSTTRDHLSIRASLDDCATWKEDVYQITGGKSGYSDMVVFDDGSVGILYENGPTHYSEQISFRRIPAATIAKYINE